MGTAGSNVKLRIIILPSCAAIDFRAAKKKLGLPTTSAAGRCYAPKHRGFLWSMECSTYPWLSQHRHVVDNLYDKHSDNRKKRCGPAGARLLIKCAGRLQIIFQNGFSAATDFERPCRRRVSRYSSPVKVGFFNRARQALALATTLA